MIKRDLYYERIPTKSLRDDVRYLGTILGKVIKEQEGLKFFKLGITFSSIFKKADLLAFSINFEKFKPLEIHNLSRSYEDFDLNKVFIIAIIKK